MSKKRYMVSVNEVAEELNVSKGHAYKLIREMNSELEGRGFIIIAGKVPRTFWETKFFGLKEEIKSA